jgi:hypothetical protein
MRDHDHNEDFAAFPVVRFARGGPSPDGESLLVEARTPQGGVLRFAILLADIQDFVSFLLVSIGKISAQQNPEVSSTRPADSSGVPIPITSISIAEPIGDEGYVEICVGRAELMFSVPVSAFGPLARALLTISGQPKRSNMN